MAAEVYKWIDEEGQTHYGKKPPSKQGERIRIRPAPNLDSESVQRTRQNKKVLKALEAERRLRQEEALKAKQHEYEMKQKCIEARKRLETRKRGGRLYRLDKDGNRVYLSDTERQKEITQWQRQVEKFCR